MLLKYIKVATALPLVMASAVKEQAGRRTFLRPVRNPAGVVLEPITSILQKRFLANISATICKKGTSSISPKRASDPLALRARTTR